VSPAPLRLVAEPEPVAAGAALLAADRVGVLDGPAPAIPSSPVAGSDPGPDVADGLARFVAAASGR
jgi:hypothetical protein